MGRAMGSVLEGLARMGVARRGVIISTDRPRRLDGQLRASAKEPDDPGVAVWFEIMVYGLYPKDQVSRINTAFLILIVWVVPLWMPKVLSKVGIGLSAVLLFPFLASYFFLGGEKALVWTALIALGLCGLIWVWSTALTETLVEKPLGSWVIGRLGVPEADERRQRQTKLICAALLFVAAFAFVSLWSLSEVRTRLWGGLFLTLVISGIGITFSLPAGILLALGRRSEIGRAHV